MDQIQTLLNKVNSVSAVAEKYSMKYNAGKLKAQATPTSNLANYTAKLYKKASSNLDMVANQSIKLAMITSQKAIGLTSDVAKQTVELARDSLKQMTSELSQDFSINTKNVLAASMAKSMPVFGYAISRAINTDVVKKLTSFGYEKAKMASSSVGHYMKEKFTEGKENLLTTFEKKKKEKREKDLVKKVESIVPKLASGGYMKKDAVIKAHKGEIVAPVDKIIAPLERISNDIHKLVKDFKSYMDVSILSMNKQASGEPITLSDLPKNTPKALRQRLRDNFAPSNFKKFLAVFLRRQLTNMQTYVKTASEGKETNLVKAFMIAYRTANEDYEAPWQERMLRATLEMRNVMVDSKTRWKMIHESMIAQSLTYKVLVGTMKTIRFAIRTPFRAAYSFFKRRGGYSGKLPKGKPAQETTALILGSIYVDFLIKYDTMITNQDKLIKILSGGQEKGAHNIIPKIWSPFSVAHKGASLLKERLTGSQLNSSGWIDEIANIGLYQTVKRRTFEYFRRKEQERQYIAKGPQQQTSLLDCCMEQIEVLKTIRKFLINRFGNNSTGIDYRTTRELGQTEIQKQKNMTAKQRAEELYKEKLKNKLKVREFNEKTSDIIARTAQRLFNKTLDKKSLRREVLAEKDIYKRVKATQLSDDTLRMGTLGSLYVGAKNKLRRPVKKVKEKISLKNLFSSGKKVKDRFDPVVILDNIRTYTKKTWKEASKGNKSKNKLWQFIKTGFSFAFSVIKDLIKSTFGKIKLLISGAIGALIAKFGISGLAGAGGLAAGAGLGIYDAYNASKKAKKWGTSKIGAALGGFFGGSGTGGMAGAAKGVLKGASIGAGIGSIVPGFGTAIGGAVGAIAGGILGFVGGKNLAKGFDYIGKGLKSLVKAVYKIVTYPVRLLWKLVKKVGGFFASITGKVLKGGVKMIGKAAWTIVKIPFKIFRWAARGIWNKLKKPMAKDIKTGFMNLWKYIKHPFDSLIGFVKKLTKPLTDGIKKLWKAASSPIDTILSAFTRIKQWIMEKLSKLPLVGKFFKEKVAKGKESLKEKVSNAKSTATNIASNTTEKLKDIKDYAVNAISPYSEKIMKKVNDVRGKFQPFVPDIVDAASRAEMGGSGQAYTLMDKLGNEVTPYLEKTKKLSRTALEKVNKKSKIISDNLKNSYEKNKKEWYNKAKNYYDEHNIENLINQTTVKGKEIASKYKAKAGNLVSDIKNEAVQGSDFIKIEADKLIVSTKLTANELAKATGKTLDKLSQDTKQAMNNLTSNVVNQVSNVTNTISQNTQNNNTNSQGSGVMDQYINALLTGDIQ